MKNELVCSIKEKIFCDSRIVAEKFGKRHGNILQAVDNLKKDLGDLVTEKSVTKRYKNPLLFVEKIHFYRGQDFRYVEMNRSAFTILAMGFSGKKALKWKLQFENAFYQMEVALLRQSNLEWQREREQGKQIRLDLADEIKIFIEYAITNGSENAKNYYSTITKMQYKALGLIEKNEKIDKQFRNTLDVMDLHNLLSAEMIAKKALLEGVDQKLHYKDIFQLAKQRVLQFADIILLRDVKYLTSRSS